jgi:hypothetical protein
VRKVRVSKLLAGIVVGAVSLLGMAALNEHAPLALAGPNALRDDPSPLARNDIPPHYRTLYTSAAHRCPQLPWSVLAGIGKVESDHGRSTAPGVHKGANHAGARGPMQFLPATFAHYGVDGDHDGRTTPYDPADAIPSAARLLCAEGAHDGTLPGIKTALYAYNHAGWYVDQTLNWAVRYTSS